MLDLSLPLLISRVITLAIAFTVHEFAHAFTADQLGDDTPRAYGRLTLNPLAHLDPIGSLLLIVAGFGWAKPVPVNPSVLQRRTPAGMMLVAAAGPFSNLLLAILASIPFQMGLIQTGGESIGLMPSLSGFLSQFIFINLILMLFNLVPIFPLDGEKVLEYFLPPSGQDFLYRLRPYGSILLIGVIFLGPRLGLDVLGWLVFQPAVGLFNLLV